MQMTQARVEAENNSETITMSKDQVQNHNLHIVDKQKNHNTKNLLQVHQQICQYCTNKHVHNYQSSYEVAYLSEFVVAQIKHHEVFEVGQCRR